MFVCFSASQMRKKQQEQLAELQANVDNLQKVKAKLEKERNQFKMEAEDLQSNFEVLSKNKASPNLRKLSNNDYSQVLNTSITGTISPLYWFDVNTIKVRVKFGTFVGWEPTIWIDCNLVISI